MNKLLRRLLLVLLLLVLGFFIYAAISWADYSTSANVGDSAPDFELEDLNGNLVRLSDFRGQPVMINFFATWCPPCIDEAPEIQKFENAYGDKIKILIIDRAEPKVLVEEFKEKFNSTSTYLLDKNDSQARPYGVVGQPETFFIDQNGIIKKHVIGPMEFEQFRQNYLDLVNGKL